MRFLADENVPYTIVQSLRLHAHDVRSIRTDFPGISDKNVFLLAVNEDRILITFDRDFGELVFRERHPGIPGIILLRISMTTAPEVAVKVTKIIQSRTDLAAHFSVVDDLKIRMLPLPA